MFTLENLIKAVEISRRYIYTGMGSETAYIADVDALIYALREMEEPTMKGIENVE